jgi:sigma-B regulation protein RsbU (phosphoserine phosphatase)
MKILIAEDEQIPRQLLQFQLQQWGHSVVVAENGRVAWELLQKHDCQLVISDWEMPEMSGIDLIRKIRETHRDGYVYAILLTSKSERSSVIAGLTTGADDYLAKPVNKDELQARLQPGLRILELEQRLAERHRELEVRNCLLADANTKMKRDLDAAAQIQQAFLPGRIQDIPNVQFAWHYSPCTELAGDMLNVMRLDDDHVGMYLLDVSGHGVQAALMAVTACRYLSSHKDASSVLWERRDGSAEYHLASPAAAAAQLNDRFVSQCLTEQYFTLVYGILNQRSGQFRYTVAGHPSPVHVARHSFPVFLSGDGFPIGVAETDYEEHAIQLNPGDRLIFYSDGVTECMNVSEELFGNSRFLRSLQPPTDHSLDSTLSRILTHIKSWSGTAPFHDDISMIALEYAPQTPLNSGESPAQLTLPATPLTQPPQSGGKPAERVSTIC